MVMMSQTSENRTKSKIPRRRLNVGSVSISHLGTDFLRALGLRGGTRGANWEESGGMQENEKRPNKQVLPQPSTRGCIYLFPLFEFQVSFFKK